jgi:DNA-binding NarL/FixJ family response regulator
MRRITVLLADDHTVVRQGLRLLLEAGGDIEVVAEAADGRQAVALARKTAPDIALMDLAMPVLNGLEASRQIRKNLPAIKVLVLTSYEDDDYVRQMVGVGVSGYLIKQTAANDLLDAVREVHRGGSFYSPSVNRRLQSLSREKAEAFRGTGASGGLTVREAEVLQLIAEGFPNKRIAAELEISIKTVEKHRQQVMNKLNIHDTAGLTRYSLSRGLLERRPQLQGLGGPPG